jgi:hypothetical protein
LLNPNLVWIILDWPEKVRGVSMNQSNQAEKVLTKAAINTEETMAWENRYKEYPEERFPFPITINENGKMEKKEGLFSVIFGEKDVYLMPLSTLRSMDGKTKVSWKNTEEGIEFWMIKSGFRIKSSLFSNQNRLICTCDKGKDSIPTKTRYFYSENVPPAEISDEQVTNILLIYKKGVIEESKMTPKCQKKTKKHPAKKEGHYKNRKRNFN